ncbi:MAG: ABC transporter permease, partial [Sphingomonas sp.]|nr:ABC transporter permease [Sphingomonas sp.]
MTRGHMLDLVLVAAIAAAMLISLMAGKVWIPLDGWASGDARWSIIAELRLPRTVLAVLVGAALGLSGAVMQGYLRNPLADPGLFGVSSGAALGAVISLYFGYASTGWLLPAFALAGAGATMAVLALIVGRSGSIVIFT